MEGLIEVVRRGLGCRIYAKVYTHCTTDTQVLRRVRYHLTTEGGLGWGLGWGCREWRD